MLNVQRKIKYHPPKELNKQKTNPEQTIKTNQQTNKQNRTKKNKKKRKKQIPSTNLWGLLGMVLDSSMICKLFLLDLSTAINL
jgi:hypothetical protein